MVVASTVVGWIETIVEVEAGSCSVVVVRRVVDTAKGIVQLGT